MQEQEKSVLKIHTLTIKYLGPETGHITSSHYSSVTSCKGSWENLLAPGKQGEVSIDEHRLCRGPPRKLGTLVSEQ